MHLGMCVYSGWELCTSSNLANRPIFPQAVCPATLLFPPQLVFWIKVWPAGGKDGDFIFLTVYYPMNLDYITHLVTLNLEGIGT